MPLPRENNRLKKKGGALLSVLVISEDIMCVHMCARGSGGAPADPPRDVDDYGGDHSQMEQKRGKSVHSM